MHRAALAAMRLTSLGLSLCALACDDKAAPAIVDDETISWQLSGAALSFKPHFPNEDKDFKVSCSISGDSIDFKITAPEIVAEGRPKSILDVRRANPAADTCIVNVKERPMLGQGEFSLDDNCKGTKADGGCVLTGGFDVDGWDFAGTLVCNKLKQQPGDPEFSLVNSVAANMPVVIKLDNCD